MQLCDLYKNLDAHYQKELIIALSHFRHVPYSTLRLENNIVLTVMEQRYLTETLMRLTQKEPLTKILGCTEFYGFKFAVTSDVLDPRQDSETLIDAVCSDYTDDKTNVSFLDLGTGSGCLIITLLLLYPKAKGFAVDLSEKALKVAQYNATFHQVMNRLTFCHGHWFDALPADKMPLQFDCIITNPPYIKSDYVLDDSVKLYDPYEALYAGIDGLDAYQALIPLVGDYLKKGGRFYGEIGFDQKLTVQNMIHQQKNLTLLQCLKDFNDNDRVIVAEYCL